MTFHRIPLPIQDEHDRRELCAILVSVGMCVRVVREKDKPKTAYQHFVEYAEQE